jgi:hypothetical protein
MGLFGQKLYARVVLLICRTVEKFDLMYSTLVSWGGHTIGHTVATVTMSSTGGLSCLNYMSSKHHTCYPTLAEHNSHVPRPGMPLRSYVSDKQHAGRLPSRHPSASAVMLPLL